jgi:hypothetical protein
MDNKKPQFTRLFIMGICRIILVRTKHIAAINNVITGIEIKGKTFPILNINSGNILMISG